MDGLLAGLLEFLLEIAGEFLIQILVELAVEAIVGRLSLRKHWRPAVSALWLACCGAAAGFLSVWLLPKPVFVARPLIPGASLLLAPLAAGLAMHLLGKRLQESGRPATTLATFWGGALFAFVMALVRWWLISRPRFPA